MIPKPNLFNAGRALSLALNILYDGKHTDGANKAALDDRSTRRQEFPFTDDVIGQTIYNLTDGSKGIITARTQSTITATLAGGTDDDWDVGDNYVIGLDVLDVQEKPQLRQIAYEQLTVVTPGTAINPTSNKGARAVRVLNNNTDGRIVYVGGSNASVDGSVSPAKGIPLYEGDSVILWVDTDASEVFIDANIATTLLDAQILGI